MLSIALVFCDVDLSMNDIILCSRVGVGKCGRRPPQPCGGAGRKTRSVSLPNRQAELSGCPAYVCCRGVGRPRSKTVSVPTAPTLMTTIIIMITIICLDSPKYLLH